MTLAFSVTVHPLNFSIVVIDFKTRNYIRIFLIFLISALQYADDSLSGGKKLSSAAFTIKV